MWPAIVGTLHYAVATDLEGKVLWKYPVSAEAEDLSAIVAADVDGDDTKEWIFAPRHGEVVVLDSGSRLVAQLNYAEKGAKGLRSSAWTAVAREGQPGWIIIAEPDRLVGYTLGPAK